MLIKTVLKKKARVKAKSSKCQSITSRLCALVTDDTNLEKRETECDTVTVSDLQSQRKGEKMSLSETSSVCQCDHECAQSRFESERAYSVCLMRMAML